MENRLNWVIFSILRLYNYTAHVYTNLLVFFSTKHTKAAWLSRKVTETQLRHFTAELPHALAFIKYKFALK